MAGTPPIERAMRYVLYGDGCWEWIASKNKKGYGQMYGWYLGGGRAKLLRSHRVFYEAFIGLIPEGMHLDHLCRNRGCVRPDHLEPVTMAENLRRGKPSPTALNAMKTECPRGHPYDKVRKRSDGRGMGRHCSICEREYERRRGQRRRKKAA